MRVPFFIAVSTLCLFLCGCGSSSSDTTVSGSMSTSGPTTNSPQQTPAMSNADLSIDTSASGISGEVSDKELAARKKTYIDAKATFAKKATPESTDNYIAATASYASATMLAGSLTPHDKYQGALRLYREAMKATPTGDNAKKFYAEAKKNEGVIVSIYKMMGRPVPE